MTTRPSGSVAMTVAELLLFPIRLAVALFMAITPPDREIAKDFSMGLGDAAPSMFGGADGLKKFAVDFANDRLTEMGRSPVASFEDIPTLANDEATRPIVVDVQKEMRNILRQPDKDKLT
jgi:hypothetical protein